ncbi:MAG: DUF2088 domain-containing protein [Synergistetes bacterium]|nr:DUF2088 domain-containing protein [Synergistota bacterium]
MVLKVPYESAEERGVFLELEVEESNLVASFIPKEPPAIPNLVEAVSEAVENPVGGEKLSSLLKGAKRVTIITENQFRQAPVYEILPWLLPKVKEAGAEATIVIGCGKVPPLSPSEIEEKLGHEVVKSGVEIYCNDVSKPENYVFVGITSYGTPLWIHRKVKEADVIITIATTQATLWGYGGSGMIIPAVSGNETIEINHIMSLAPDCLPGNNECKMQQDKYEAARMAGVSMGINLIVSNAYDVIYVNAGDFVEAHKEAIRFYDNVYRFKASEFKDKKADIAIVGSSAPTDHLFFHTGWAVVNALPVVKKGGTIIFATPCPGYGSWPGFALMDLMADFLPPTDENHEKVLKAFYDRTRELWAGCIWYKIYTAMLHADIYLITREENFDMARQVGFSVFKTIEEAYRAALDKHGADAKVAFIPYGRYTIIDTM